MKPEIQVLHQYKGCWRVTCKSCKAPRWYYHTKREAMVRVRNHRTIHKQYDAMYVAIGRLTA